MQDYIEYIKENYELLKNKIEETVVFKKTYVCEECGKTITYNGATSHRHKCQTTFLSRDKSIKESFNNICIICGKTHPINNKNNIYLKNIHYLKKNFCSHECYKKANKIILDYSKIKKCVICNKEFINPRVKTCSKECNATQLSKKLKNIWATTKDERSENISKGRIKLVQSKYKFQSSWNAGLTGKEYLRHYEKDGVNTLYEGLKKNDKFFKKTSIEIKIEKYLQEQKITYQYSWFNDHRQYDFFVKFKNCYVIIEADGDYWHKSKRIFSDFSEREIKRKEDQLKENQVLKCNFKMPIFFLRFWEYDIINHFDYIEKIIKEINNGNIDSIKQTVSKNKKHYSNWS